MTNFTKFVIIVSWFIFYRASSQSIVKTLPGYSGNLPFKLETGYISVGESDDIELFYYFIESERNPKDDPLLLWLTGGPGCSGLYGLTFEFGPIAFDASSFNGSLPSLILRQHSWTKIANVIFIDSPVGTGFSYGTKPNSYNISDTLSAVDTYTFMRKWLLNHHMFIGNDMYIAGDSYAGKIVPIVVLEILKGRLMHDDTMDDMMSYAWANNQEVQDTLHVRKGTIKVWNKCNTLTPAYDKNVASAVPYHQLLTHKIPKAMVYSGDHDLSVTYLDTLKWIQLLNLTVDDGWRPWKVSGQVAGYTQRYKNDGFYLTFATVKGAGHTAPEFKPEESLAMVDRWISSNPL